MNIEKEILVFCENIKRLRSMHNLSKTQMAKLLHVSPKTLTTIESGTVLPKLGYDIMFEIRRNFGIPAHEMFTQPLEDTKEK